MSLEKPSFGESEPQNFEETLRQELVADLGLDKNATFEQIFQDIPDVDLEKIAEESNLPKNASLQEIAKFGKDKVLEYLRSKQGK